MNWGTEPFPIREGYPVLASKPTTVMYLFPEAQIQPATSVFFRCGAVHASLGFSIILISLIWSSCYLFLSSEQVARQPEGPTIWQPYFVLHRSVTHAFRGIQWSVGFASFFTDDKCSFIFYCSWVTTMVAFHFFFKTIPQKSIYSLFHLLVIHAHETLQTTNISL